MTVHTVDMEPARRQEEEAGQKLLRTAADRAAAVLRSTDRPLCTIETHLLPGKGGASGVAESLVEFSRRHSVDLVVVGSRGLGALRRSLLDLVGLGSVSDYLVHHLQCPVLVVRHPEDKGRIAAIKQQVQGGRKVVLAVDESEHSVQALHTVVRCV